jgi:excisionase family DNA binding protein
VNINLAERNFRMSRVAYTVAEAAEAAGLHHVKVREAIKTGRLPARRVGKPIVILAADLVAWLESLPSVAAVA